VHAQGDAAGSISGAGFVNGRPADINNTAGMWVSVAAPGNVQGVAKSARVVFPAVAFEVAPDHDECACSGDVVFLLPNGPRRKTSRAQGRGYHSRTHHLAVTAWVDIVPRGVVRGLDSGKEASDVELCRVEWNPHSHQGAGITPQDIGVRDGIGAGEYRPLSQPLY